MKLEQSTRQILKICFLGIGITAIAFFLFQYIGFFNNLNDLVLDRFMLHSDHRPPDDRVLIIKEDDESVSKLRHAIPRSAYVKLVRKLSLVGAKTIAFDLLFIDEKDPQGDSHLAAVTDSFQHVVHCFNFNDEEPKSGAIQDKSYEKYAIPIKEGNKLNFISARNATFPHKKFIDFFNQAGHITAEWDYDGRFRRIPLVIEFNNRFYPTLGIAALMDYLGIDEEFIRIERTLWGRNIIIETAAEIITIPINSKGQAVLNFYGNFNVFKSVSLHEVIHLLDAFQPKDSLKITLPLFDGKIVLIGNTETGEDNLVVPFSANFPGVGIHATLISNILQGALISELNWAINAIISLVLILVILGLFIYYQQFSKPIWTFCMFVFSLFIVFNAMAYFLFFDYLKVWLKLVQIDSAFIVFFISLLFYEKVIRLKELNDKIDQLEDDIFIKKTDLERLDQKINSQTEQYKTIKYFVSQLQTVLKGPPVDSREDLRKFFPEFFKQYERMKISLEGKIQELILEKERISREKENLEQEKNIIEDYLKGNLPTKQKPPLVKLQLDKMKVAQEIMSAWEYFQSQQKKGKIPPDWEFGIIALTEIITENGDKRTTPMGEIIENIKKISSYDSTVLITGEIGAGKDLVARAIHEQSKRANKRLVPINCAAIPENLMESELFGHKKGAFTDAKYDHKGAFEYADGGTIFLDEIGELKLDLQAKLLRVLQNNEIQKVGSNEPIKVDVRVIAATNKNLKKCIENNEFRSDLYSRLHVVDLHIPPLRERKYDIPSLMQYFVNKFNTKHDKQKSFSSETIIAAMCYDWPNNIRDLQNFVEKVCVLTTEDELQLSSLPAEIQTAYRDIFESDEVPWWSHIETLVQQEQKRLLDGCKTAIKKDNIDEFLSSNYLQADNKTCANYYEYFLTFVNGIASIFPADKRESLVRSIIVQTQEQLFQWCRKEKIAKLSDLYDTIEKLLGRSRRQVDNWRKVR